MDENQVNPNEGMEVTEAPAEEAPAQETGDEAAA